MTQLAWGLKVSAEFRAQLEYIRRTFKWTQDQANWLMACIAFESGETFSASIRNMAGSGAVGLIQFMPTTAISLGTTATALAAMTPVQQLDYVQKYFRPYAPRCITLPDMYMAILLPSRIGAAPSSVLFTRGTTAYRQNSALDANTDGYVTKTEAAARVQAKLVKGLRTEFALAVGV